MKQDKSIEVLRQSAEKSLVENEQRLVDIIINSGVITAIQIQALLENPESHADFGVSKSDKDKMLQTFAVIGYTYVMRAATNKLMNPEQSRSDISKSPNERN